MRVFGGETADAQVVEMSDIKEDSKGTRGDQRGQRDLP